jgi:GNAT superfamily N-acetyltransferase
VANLSLATSPRLSPLIQRESLAQLRAAGVDALLVRHWREIAHYQDIPLEVDYPVYEAAEAAGKLRIFTVRLDGELVGYSCYFVNSNPHYKSSVQAVQDVLFLAPEYRKAAIGRQLIAYADVRLAAEGVQVTYQHSKAALPIDALLKRQGYEFIERIWAKRHDRRR